MEAPPSCGRPHICAPDFIVLQPAPSMNPAKSLASDRGHFFDRPVSAQVLRGGLRSSAQARPEIFTRNLCQQIGPEAFSLVSDVFHLPRKPPDGRKSRPMVRLAVAYVGASNVIQDSAPDRFVSAHAVGSCRHDVAWPASTTNTKHAIAALASDQPAAMPLARSSRPVAIQCTNLEVWAHRFCWQHEK